jgi:NADH-quinone oxidoreductase subunit J
MAHALFVLCSVFTVACAVGVVASKNAVNGAMCLLLCLVGVAGLFVQLHAYLLAFVLLLVYAGAVVALFLFIIMLLDMQGGAPWRYRGFSLGASLVALALLLCGLNLLAARGRLETPPVPAGAPAIGATLKAYSYQLFTTYLLPVEVIGLLLLIAMLGVIVLSKRYDGTEGGA